jgi:hypothetical protein
MARPSPGEVWYFANEVRRNGAKDIKWKGFLAAANWVFGENGSHKHPYTEEIVKNLPPTMDAIAKVVKGTDAERKMRKVSSDYCDGVERFLSWIIGSANKPR